MKLNWQKAMAILALALTVALVPLPAIASANGARGARVVSVALSYLRRPYVFGATGPRTFDCSGFTRCVMNRPGVSHVGIALGNGRMVHAWTRGGVRIDRLSQAYFVAKYHSSRTVLR